MINLLRPATDFNSSASDQLLIEITWFVFKILLISWVIVVLKFFSVNVEFHWSSSSILYNINFMTAYIMIS